MTTPDNAEMTARIAAHNQAQAAATASNADIPPLNPPGQQADTQPQKRGRGRPPKNRSAETMQQQINATASKGEASAKKAAKKAASAGLGDVDVSKLGGQIQGLHLIAAKVTGMPFMMLSEKESFALAESIVGVAEQYELTINPKMAAGLQLLATAAMIYGPRAIAFTQYKKQAINAAQMRAASGQADDVSANTAG